MKTLLRCFLTYNSKKIFFNCAVYMTGYILHMHKQKILYYYTTTTTTTSTTTTTITTTSTTITTATTTNYPPIQKRKTTKNYRVLYLNTIHTLLSNLILRSYFLFWYLIQLKYIMFVTFTKLLITVHIDHNIAHTFQFIIFYKLHTPSYLS